MPDTSCACFLAIIISASLEITKQLKEASNDYIEACTRSASIYTYIFYYNYIFAGNIESRKR